MRRKKYKNVVSPLYSRRFVALWGELAVQRGLYSFQVWKKLTGLLN